MTSERDTQPTPPPSLPPPKGPSATALVAVLALLLAAFVAGVFLSTPARSLVSHIFHKQPAKADESHPYWTCGMHPWVVLPEPGDCPICHMKLVPLDASKFTKEIAIDPTMTQNIGVRVSPVVSGPVRQVIRTVGAVDYDETLVRDVNLKVSGWVEKLYINSVGQEVAKDQPLLDIYSPELYSAQVEYLLALKGKDILRSSDNGSDSDLLTAGRKRLENLDISPAQIAELEKSGKATKTMALRSPFRGTVVAKSVLDGQRVDAGTSLLRIADLSKVWIMVTVYEYQIPFVEVGQKAVMSLPYIPGQTFEGKVAYVYPYLNAELRQAKVRLEFENPRLLLKPGMFANVELVRTLVADRTLVPREAVIDTGTRQIAFVSLGGGRFEPRRVQVGVEAENGTLEILDGLKPGERVVTSGEFLLDSESRLREALEKMVKGTLAATQPTQAATAGASELAAMPEDASKALSSVLDGYLAAWMKLSGDTLDGVPPAAKEIASGVDALIAINLPDRPHFWHEHTEVAEVGAHARALATEKDIDKARQHFADMSIALRKLLRATGVPPAFGKEVQELHCPMYRENQGGTVWLQTPGEVRNPYYGSKMLGCFDTRYALPVTGQKAEGAK